MASTKTFNQPPLQNKLLSQPVLIALFSVYVIWGATDLGNEFALQSYPPFMLVALRLLLATVILIGFLKLRGVPFPPMNQMLTAVVIGGLMFGGRSGFLAFARAQGLGEGITSLGIATIPLWAILFALFFGYRPSKLELLGVVIGLGGIMVLNIENDWQSDPITIVILLIAPMLWSFGSMYRTHWRMPDGFMAPAFQMMGGCIVLTVMSFLRGEQFPAEPTLQATTALLFLSVAGTLVAFTAYMYLVRTVNPGLATSYAYVNPIVAVLFEIALFGEFLSSTGLLAMVVIGVSVVLVMIGKSRASATPV